MHPAATAAHERVRMEVWRTADIGQLFGLFLALRTRAVEMKVCGKNTALPTDLGNSSCSHIPTARLQAKEER